MPVKMQRSLLAGLVVSASLLSGSIVDARAQQDFIVTGEKIINSQVPQEFVGVSERIPIAQLKRRFARYKVKSTTGEGCAICAVISKEAFQFEVHYGAGGVVVTGIFCRDNACVDAKGNRVGGSLRQAVGNAAACDQGDETTCKSSKLIGLSYIVRESDKCPLRVTANGRKSNIPACARIDGFHILKKQ